jgi:threonine/homoserine/homoserine lactone efflux protein
MGSAIGDILPAAIGVAISPLPIIAVVLMLATPRGRTNGVAFAAGWILGLSAVGAIVLAAGSGNSTSTGGPATWASVLKLVVGVLFLLLAVRQWRSRPKAGEEASLPGWMRTIDAFTPGKSLGFGVILSAANPKNLGLALAAAVGITQAGISTGEEIVVLVIFVALASVSIVGPVVLRLTMPERSRELLDELKAWLGLHNAAIMTVLFLVLGVKLVGDAIGGLSS